MSKHTSPLIEQQLDDVNAAIKPSIQASNQPQFDENDSNKESNNGKKSFPALPDERGDIVK